MVFQDLNRFLIGNGRQILAAAGQPLFSRLTVNNVRMGLDFLEIVGRMFLRNKFAHLYLLDNVERKCFFIHFKTVQCMEYHFVNLRVDNQLSQVECHPHLNHTRTVDNISATLSS